MLKIVLITGISGSGKSVALRLLEDAGYTCVDNLPVRFLHDFIASTRESELERVAVAIDVRSPGELAELPDVITRSEARRVGKECVSTRRSRWSQTHYKKNSLNRRNKTNHSKK